MAVALAMLGGLFAAFVDFRGLVPVAFSHRLAALQFVPSWVALLTGASLAGGGVILILITLLLGRVYCSAICPLGILQDVLARLARLTRGAPGRLRFSPGLPWLRYSVLWASVAGILFGGAAFILPLLDPYSLFGRIVSGLLRPLVTQANNALVGPANAAGIDALYRVNVPWSGLGLLALPGATLMLIAILAAWRGRIYCNTICPVGTLLGLLASRSVFRLRIDEQACQKCGDCLKVCKAQCIDLRARQIDFSRCVGCFNCVAICRQHGISFRRPTPAHPPVARAIAPHEPGLTRREFLAQGAPLIAATGPGFWSNAVGPSRSERFEPVIAPPGANNVRDFLDRCTGCQLCISTCPTHVLQPACFEYGLAGFMKPRLDYRHAFCNFDCRECGQVCPDGAIVPMALADKQLTRIGGAQLNLDHCVVKTKGTDCAACSEHCPTKAVYTVPYGNNLRLPRLDESICIGCGGCEYACPAQPAKAITVAGLNRHERAEIRVEKKLPPPAADGNFPF